MILVAMGEDNRFDVLNTILQVINIGKDEINTGLAFFREEDATIDDDELAAVLKDVTVSSHLT